MMHDKVVAWMEILWILMLLVMERSSIPLLVDILTSLGEAVVDDRVGKYLIPWLVAHASHLSLVDTYNFVVSSSFCSF